MEGKIFVFWNWSVAVYLFVAGVSAGAFFISALAFFLGNGKYKNISRLGAYIAPFPLLLGILCLIYDLERPFLFWKLLLTFQSHSVMSLGSWLLLIFSFLSFLNFYLWLPERFDLVELFSRLLSRLGKIKIISKLKNGFFLQSLQRQKLNNLRSWISLAGIPVSLLVGIYTGVLLGVLVARPFWNNPMLPMLFLVSALKTGTASICFIGCFIKSLGGMSREEVETNKFVIHSIDFVLMILSLIAVTLFIFGLYSSPRSSGEAVKLIMGGEFTFVFWVMVVGFGIIFPMGLEIYELIPHFIKQVPLREHNPWISGAVATSVLVGGFLLRHVVVYAGQMAKIITS